MQTKEPRFHICIAAPGGGNKNFPGQTIRLGTTTLRNARCFVQPAARWATKGTRFFASRASSRRVVFEFEWDPTAENWVVYHG
jgi:hypothetical protein